MLVDIDIIMRVFMKKLIELQVCIMIHQNNQIHKTKLNSYLDSLD